MNSITFTFQPAASEEEQKQTLAEVSDWAGVKTAAYLKPGARNPKIARMAYAVLANDADPQEIASNLDRLSAVESASVPPARYLVAKH
jgi:hypothetical protein